MTQAPLPSVLVVIPARGGSKGIPRKNLRSLHGRPLIAHVIGMAKHSSYTPLVLVTSEDDEILSVATILGAECHLRPERLAADAIPLDEVVYDAYRAMVERHGREFDVVVTVQPTSPLLTAATLDRAIAKLWSSPGVDTVLSASDDTHLRWGVSAGKYTPEYTARLNRQYLPKTYRETGGIFASRAGSLKPSDRIGNNVDLIVVDGPEGIDIDGAEDWARCEWDLGRRDVLLVVTGNKALGLGHAHNALAVADSLTRHRVRFLVDGDSELAAATIAARNYDVTVQTHRRLADDIVQLGPDLVINDRLDTSAAYVRALKDAGCLVVNFEDLGPGARLADLVINAIYPEREWIPNHYFGHRYYCPRPEFVVTGPQPIRDSVKTVLVTFGGTDPNNLTERVVRTIGPHARRNGIDIRVILGLGYKHQVGAELRDNAMILQDVANMATHMREADIVFTSAGRTTFEVACVGTPTVVLAQNHRELTHLFATADHGFANLGLARKVSDRTILAEFTRLVSDPVARAEMQRRLTAENLNGGLERVRLLIEGLATT